MNLVAELVRGMRVDDALMQLAVSTKRAAKVVAKVVHLLLMNRWESLHTKKLSTLESWSHAEIGSGLVCEGMYEISDLNICQTKSVVCAGHDFCSCQCHSQPWFG